MGGTRLVRLLAASVLVGDEGTCSLASVARYDVLFDDGSLGEVGASAGRDGGGGGPGRGGRVRFNDSVTAASTCDFTACKDISSSDSEPALGSICGGGSTGRAAHVRGAIYHTAVLLTV
jgi:hypothetical protein